MHRQVNGITIQISPEEEKTIRSEWRAEEQLQNELLLEHKRKQDEKISILERIGLSATELDLILEN